MKLSAWQYIFYLTVVFACGYANAGAIAKRDTSSSEESDSALWSLILTIESFLLYVPLVGSSLVGIIDWVVQAVSLFEIGTNGALARLLGGALPCTVSLDGTVCSGLTSNGGFGALLMQVLEGVPGLPGLFKTVIALFIQMFIDPTVDVIFGGVVIPA